MKGDAKLIEVLNQLLAEELTAISQYMVHSEMCDGWGYEKLHKAIGGQAMDEMHHAEWLIQRILFLEGTPNLAKREALKVGKNVPDMLKADLDVEYRVVGELKKAIAACEKAQDYVSRDMLVVQLEDTEMDHAYYLEQQVRLISLVGLKNYQQSQMKPGTPA